jgi:uncharacterized protein YchJ
MKINILENTNKELSELLKWFVNIPVPQRKLLGKVIYYMQADLPGRNDICFCGSGKKYKKCCGNKK